MAPRLTSQTLELLRTQHDVVAGWQLSQPQRRAFRRGCRLGQVSLITPRVFRLGAGEAAQAAQLWAAVLHCGPRARLGGQAALTLHGWTGQTAKPFDVVVPPQVQPQRVPDWIKVHRLTTPGFSHLSPPRVSAHDATCQAGAWARSEREAVFVVISALQQRLTTPDRLLAAATATMRNHEVITHAVLEYRDGIQSVPEYDFRRLCRRYGLPEPARQTQVRDNSGKVRSIDVEYRVAGRVIRVEVEGVHHLRPEAWLDDIDRHNDIVVSGSDAYLRVATITLRRDPKPFMLLLRSVLQRLALAS